MDHYDIALLEQLTGVRAHTLRMWERRYGLVKPHRTEGNFRYYDDRQARHLMQVCLLVNNGHRISEVAEMGPTELASCVTGLRQAGSGEAVSDTLVSDLLSAAMDFNETAFDKTLSLAIGRLGIFRAVVEVVYPFYEKTGLLWMTGSVMPAQEHFASCVVRRKLMAAGDALPPPGNSRKKFVVFAPEGEWHEMGLLLADVVIRSAGFSTVYLGQNVPLANLSTVIEKVRPTHLVTQFITRRDPDEIHRHVHEVRKALPEGHLWILGQADGKRNAANVTLLPNPADLLLQVDALRK